MILKLKNPLVVFDLETTGTNIATDRIVEIAMIKMMPDGTEQEKVRRLNPTIPIPLEASMVHGIYDADVADEPTFKQVAKSLAQFLEGCDLAGFNIMKFDIPLLVEEFLRAGVDFEIDQRNLVDAQKIFHMMEKRNLTAAYKFYCGKDLINAHSAAADTRATMEVLLAQIERYKGEALTDLAGVAMGTITNQPEQLDELLNQKLVDLAGRIVYDDKGREIFNFGKHKGKTVQDVLDTEPSFYDWMMKGDFPLDTKRKLTKLKLRSFNQKK